MRLSDKAHKVVYIQIPRSIHPFAQIKDVLAYLQRTLRIASLHVWFVEDR